MEILENGDTIKFTAAIAQVEKNVSKTHIR